MKTNNHILLTNGQIIDVEMGVVSQGAIEIRDGMIKKVFLEKDELPQHVKKIDLKGKYIIPGLIDMHCHIREEFAHHFIAAGVTTVRNTAGDLSTLQPLIDAPLDAPTPIVYSADWLIDGEPGLWGATGEGNYVTDDPDAARQEVQRQIATGAKFIKIYGLIKTEVMLAVVEEAHKYNVEVSCDLHHAKEIDALTAAKSGVTWFEHASGFAQGVYPGWHVFADKDKWQHINWLQTDYEKIKTYCEQMLQFNVKLCPTFIVQDQGERMPHVWNPKNMMSTSVEKQFKDYWAFHLEHSKAVQEQIGFLNTFIKTVAKTYADLGGTVVVGTDTPALPGIFPGMALHRELELFVEAGFSTLQALQAATMTAAQSIHLNSIGVIQEDYTAHLVILEKNPLENISNTQSITHVVKGGKIYQQEECIALL